MSQGYRAEHPSGPPQEPLVWERVEWRQGDGRYVFEVVQGGLHATLTSPHGRALTLPVIAWDALLDAIAAARKTRTRAERDLPARAGARWSEAETGELVKAFKAGGSIAQLARAHNRTQYAVEAQLDRLGLWDRVERRPTGAFRPDPGGSPPLATHRLHDRFAPTPAAGRRERAGDPPPSLPGGDPSSPAALRSHPTDRPIPFAGDRD